MTNTPQAWKNSTAHNVTKLLDEVRDLYFWQAKNLQVETKHTSKTDGKWNVSDITLMSQNGLDAKEKTRYTEILLHNVVKRFENVFDAVGFAGLEQIQRDIYTALYTEPDKTEAVQAP